MSPRGPPRWPAFPTPRSVMYCPVATPGGTSIEISRSSRNRPSPRHFLHGVCTVVPSPLHVGHGATVTNCPKNERCARRTSPLPLHVAHVCAFEPGSAPLPVQRSQGSSSFALIFFSTPVATSARVSCIVTLTSAPARTLPPDRPPPKPNISSRPAKAPK